jgi:uncharacterized circularly permuted ATP-grasp superfamily protein/uncharacterized alpha-E superfamily protein
MPDLSPLAADYVPPAQAFDELGGAHFQRFLERIEALGTAEVGRRWQMAQQLIRENGVTYNVYGDPQGLERPWRLSPLPLLVGAEDWTRLARGLAQRAELLNALLDDLYGRQRALSEGLLPPELVFAHPNFLRAVSGVAPPRRCFLPIYAADLIRAPSGQFLVLGDKTQAPSGSGYALENRIVIARALPEAFRECNVERLAPYFRTLRQTLEGLAPHNRDSPRIVLLASGPANATYFEQAYLAKYLGFTLVSGADLTVRSDRVFLKTLGGLQPVDVLLRRVNDDFCDPLELRPDSLLGVPGLTQAARAGNVAVANALGSGLVQSAAFLPYLPQLCRLLLEQELQLPSVRTLFCGEAEALGELFADFTRWVIKPTFPGRGKPEFVATLPDAERQALAARIRAQPSAYVAQEYVTAAVTPALVDGKLAPRSYVLRCYAFSDGVGGYLALPGGLARAAESDAHGAVTMQLGARSKDVWVLSQENVGSFSLLPAQNRPLRLSRGGGDLQSRVADDLYWLGRYAERADAVARLARVLGARLGEFSDEEELERCTEFGALFAALRGHTDRPPGSIAAGQSRLVIYERELISALTDSGPQGSLVAVIHSALRVGRTVRDRISMDTWRVLAGLAEELRAAPARLGPLLDLLNSVVVAIAAFGGLVMDGMTRGQAFRFLDMGRRVERALNLVTLLRETVTQQGAREAATLDAVLEIADSGMTYRRRYMASLQVAPAVDLLLVDETNARSVVYQLAAVIEHLRALPRLPDAPPRSPELRLALLTAHELELCDVHELCEVDAGGARPKLATLLRSLGGQLPALSDALSATYLSHASVSRHLSQELGTAEPVTRGEA